MKEKAQTARGDGERDPIHEVLIRVCGEEHPTEGGGERDTASNAVDAVHEVVGVGETDDPQEGDDEADRAELQLSEERNGDGFEIAHTEHGCECDQPLHAKAHTRTERMDIISPAEVGDDCAADEVDDAVNYVCLEGCDTSRHEDDDDNGESPTAWSRRGMGTALVGMIDDTAAFGVLTDNPHAEGGEDGEECEDEDGSHGGDSKREIGSCLIWELILFRWAFSPHLPRPTVNRRAIPTKPAKADSLNSPNINSSIITSGN